MKIGEMLSQMNLDQRIRYLLHLANELTIAARADTYEDGTDGVQKPADLRRYNEVMHRVLANLRDLVESRREDIWCWTIIVEASRILPSIGTASRRAVEFSHLSS
jgi:hypothetical protein